MKLELKNISKTFITEYGNQVTCLENQNMMIHSGEMHVLYGDSGNGKTTLLNIMTGMLKPTSGSVLLDGKEIQNLNEKDKAGIRQQYFGYIMQEAAMIPSLTVYQNITLPFMDYKIIETETMEQKIEEFGLSRVRNSRVGEISGGEYRRCAVLRAIVAKRPFLFADEPTANLDERNAEKMIEVLEKALKGGAAVVIATHDKRILDRNNILHEV